MPAPAAGVTRGTVDRVPCAHCGTPQDLRPAKEAKLLDTGIDVTCDKCNKTSQVVAVKDVTMVALRQRR